jgi:hypothetical protein
VLSMAFTYQMLILDVFNFPDGLGFSI